MEQRTRALVASGGVVAIFLLVQLGALALVEPFTRAGLRAVENPQNPANSLLYVAAVLVATALLLAAIRFDLGVLIRLFVVGSAAYVSLLVLWIYVPPFVTVDVAGVPVNALAVALAGALGVALWAYPEWYVVDGAGVLMGASAAALFGISFGLLPALVLLVALAAYDAVSVYGTEHMLTLASGVMDLKVPIVLVVPLRLSYSYLDAEMPDPTSEGSKAPPDSTHEGGTDATDDGATDVDEGEMPDSASADGADGAGGAFDRDALFIGLGDAIVPTVLVTSAAVFLPDSVPSVALPWLAAPVPALTAMVGTLAGLVVLLWMVLQGRAHAGLPLLNGGAIAGYLVGALATGLSLVRAIGLA